MQHSSIISFLCPEIHCNTLQHTATHCNTLQHTATHCSTLQHTAAYCSTLQHAAAHCSTLQHTTTHCNTLSHSATHCHTPQHTTTHCSILSICLEISRTVAAPFFLSHSLAHLITVKCAASMCCFNVLLQSTFLAFNCRTELDYDCKLLPPSPSPLS